MSTLTRARESARGGRGAGGATAVVLLCGIALLSADLRPAVVAIGPLADRIRDDTGLGSAQISLLTTLPLVCFGVFSAFAPRLGRRIGIERALVLSASVLVAGIALRLAAGSVPLFVGSAVAGAGIAVGNVLLPSLIKRDFPERTGPVMAVYSVALNGGAALAAGLTVPIGDALAAGWRETLAVWGVLAAATVLVWIPIALRGSPVAAAAGDPSDSGGAVSGGAAPVRVWRSPLAWSVAIFMGTQSLVYYSLSAWLPSLLQDHGMSESLAGVMLSIMSVAGIATAFATPVLAARLAHQRWLVVSCAGLFAAGLAGVLIAPVGGAVAWMILLGAGQGVGISLALTLFVLRTRSAPVASELSGMAQTIGYLIAALGPLLVGALHGATGGWTVPMLALAALLIVIVLAGWRAAADRAVETSGAR